MASDSTSRVCQIKKKKNTHIHAHTHVTACLSVCLSAFIRKRLLLLLTVSFRCCCVYCTWSSFGLFFSFSSLMLCNNDIKSYIYITLKKVLPFYDHAEKTLVRVNVTLLAILWAVLCKPWHFKDGVAGLEEETGGKLATLRAWLLHLQKKGFAPTPLHSLHSTPPTRPRPSLPPPPPSHPVPSVHPLGIQSL